MHMSMNGAVGIERHRWASREAEVRGSERVNTRLSGSGWVDDIQSHPQGEFRGRPELINITEDVLKFPAEQKISEEEALQVGLEQKARGFSKAGSELYSKV
jgi:hypothetical protein